MGAFFFYRVANFNALGSWKRCSIVAKCVLEVEIAMGAAPVPISVSSGHFALRYEGPKFLARGGHLCMARIPMVNSKNPKYPTQELEESQSSARHTTTF